MIIANEVKSMMGRKRNKTTHLTNTHTHPSIYQPFIMLHRPMKHKILLIHVDSQVQKIIKKNVIIYYYCIELFVDVHN